MAPISVAVINVGGPSTSNFRALGVLPSPLFLIGGRPIIDAPLRAAAHLPGLRAIYVVGFYDQREFATYLNGLASEFGIPVRYLHELSGHGSAGGLHQFRALILEKKPEHIFVLNCDVCCTWPLADLQAAHAKRPGAMGTLLATRVPAKKASEFAQVVAHEATGELLHYTERPQTLVSDLVNAGVYIFSPALFTAIGACLDLKQEQAVSPRFARTSLDQPSAFVERANMSDFNEFVRLDGDILMPYAGKGALFVHEHPGFWAQVKTPSMMLHAAELYLGDFQRSQPALLLRPSAGGPAVSGAVYVHPSAQVHPTAKLGPNCNVAPGVRVGAGARLSNCIVLDNAVVGEHAVVAHAIIGWSCKLGSWARVQGSADYEAKLGVAILGEDVTVAEEVVIVSSVVLPHKEIKSSLREEIIM